MAACASCGAPGALDGLCDDCARKAEADLPKGGKR